jgi:hypothetical protein
MNRIIEQLPEWNSWIALLLYWLPMAMCAYGYTVRSILKVKRDLEWRRDAEAEGKKFYYPTITVGSLIGYAMMTVTPIANLFAAIFDVSPKLFKAFFNWCGRVLDMPLVPAKKKGPQA